MHLHKDPFAAELEEITKDPEEHPKYTWYLSTLIRAIPSMKSTSPYISPETLFINPHEAPVEVRKPGKMALGYLNLFRVLRR